MWCFCRSWTVKVCCVIRSGCPTPMHSYTCKAHLSKCRSPQNCTVYQCLASELPDTLVLMCTYDTQVSLPIHQKKVCLESMCIDAICTGYKRRKWLTKKCRENWFWSSIAHLTSQWGSSWIIFWSKCSDIPLQCTEMIDLIHPTLISHGISINSVSVQSTNERSDLYWSSSSRQY